MVATPPRPDLLTSDRSRGLRVRPPAPSAERPEAPAPIGLVAFRTHRGEPAEAILDAAGTWDCPQLPVLNRPLNALFVPGRNAAGPEPFGHRELARVADWVKGEVRPPHPPE